MSLPPIIRKIISTEFKACNYGKISRILLHMTEEYETSRLDNVPRDDIRELIDYVTGEIRHIIHGTDDESTHSDMKEMLEVIYGTDHMDVYEDLML